MRKELQGYRRSGADVADQDYRHLRYLDQNISPTRNRLNQGVCFITSLPGRFLFYTVELLHRVWSSAEKFTTLSWSHLSNLGSILAALVQNIVQDVLE